MKQFRYDISFLRAFSVIIVLLYHFKFSLFNGGFIGVDIFFVISGYLMTMIILNGFSKNTFSLTDFYNRRVVRIIPPLLFLIFSFGVAVYFILPTQLLNYSKSAFSSSLFFSNIYYYLNSNYFDASSQYNFLLHTWSLSVEWQFYMIYPLLLLIFRKTYVKSPKKFNIVFVGLILISFLLMLIHNKNESIYSFYIFYPRAWEMMAGGLAFLFSNYSKNINEKLKQISVIFSLVVISIFVYKINEHQYTWPSFYTLTPVILTTLIIFLNVDNKLFRNKVVTYLGNISYSLYLWHWPIYVISLYYEFNGRLRHKLFFILLSFLGAMFSYHLIEKRDFRKYSKQIITTSLVCFGVFFGMNYINPELLFRDSKIGNLAHYTSNYKYSKEAEKQYNFHTKHFMHTQNYTEWNADILKIDSTKKNIVLLGDSHAGMFAQSFEELANKYDFNLIQTTADATFPMINSETKFIECQKYFNYIFEDFFPKNYQEIDLIVINSNYEGYPEDELLKKIRWTEEYFKKLGVKTIYIGQNQTFYIDYPTSYYLKKQPSHSYNKYDVFLSKLLKEKYINLNNNLINYVSKDGTPFIYDHGHLSKYGTDQYLKLISTNIINQY